MTVGPEALGNITRFVSPLPDGEGGTVAPLVSRFALRIVAGEIMPNERVNKCLKRIIPTAQHAELWRNPEKQTGHWHKLYSCGSVWHCPVCAAHITERRRIEVQAAIDRALEMGWKVALLTFTLQHSRDDSLSELLEALILAIRKTQQGKRWMAIKSDFAIQGSISALEFTASRANGWHPHKHIILFYREDQDLEALQAEISTRYRGILANLGRFASAEVGVDLRAGDSAVGEYLAKWGMAYEIAKAPMKKGRHDSFSPFELLALAWQGDKWARKMFQEYARVTKGRKQLFWSRGLRDALGLGQEASDEDLAGDDLVQPGEERVLFASLTRQQFTRLNQIEQTRKGIKGELKALAGAGDVGRFWAFLASLGIYPTGLDQTVIGVYDGLDPRNYPPSGDPPGETVKNGDVGQRAPQGAWEGVESILNGKRCQTTIEKQSAFSGASQRLKTELEKDHNWDDLNSRLQEKINQARNR